MPSDYDGFRPRSQQIATGTPRIRGGSRGRGNWLRHVHETTFSSAREAFKSSVPHAPLPRDSHETQDSSEEEEYTIQESSGDSTGGREYQDEVIAASHREQSPLPSLSTYVSQTPPRDYSIVADPGNQQYIQEIYKNRDEKEEEPQLGNRNRAREWGFLKHTTISEDRTAESNYKEKQLAVLKDATTVKTKVAEKPFQAEYVTGNHAVQDYQMQLMLLEQQNKKRLLMARQEQDKMAALQGDGPDIIMRPSAAPMNQNRRDAIALPVAQYPGIPQPYVACEAANERSGSLMQSYATGQSSSIGDLPTDTSILRGNLENINMDNTRVLLESEENRTTIDTPRGTKRKHLDLLEEYLDSIHMRDRMAQLMQQNKLLSEQLEKLTKIPERCWCTLYRFQGEEYVYLEPPRWTMGQSAENTKQKSYILKGVSPLKDPEQYLSNRKEIAFVVYKYYRAEWTSELPKLKGQHGEIWEDPDPVEETVRFISEDMLGAIDLFFRFQPGHEDVFPNWEIHADFLAPYRFWYYYRHTFESCYSIMSGEHQAMLALWKQFANSYEARYQQADDQMKRGFTSSCNMIFLIRPGDVVVSQANNEINGYLATTWAIREPQNSRKSLMNSFGIPEKRKAKQKGDAPDVEIWSVSTWSYGHNGMFVQKRKKLEIEVPLGDADFEIPLEELNIIPLRFASAEICRRLERRGSTFWKCRGKSFVSYQGDDVDLLNSDGDRFMIDYPTYKKLHSEDPEKAKLAREEPSIEMPEDEILDGNQRFILPPGIIGYNLRRKKWVDLEVDRIRDVTWNKNAFDKLEVEDDTKELIKALVTNRLDLEKGTDFMENKGNGLTILLHGGPGTGKTFTAESVAELAEKPLYRVTCGDIGTFPEEVEQYLESALHLGKIWDCVVLLDEADVFLEERTLNDLQRNALVTVFLRVLEYYNGILILTSNRVGTFDEAFKSRIQLSLHYPNLTKSQRQKIWHNMLKRLEEIDRESIDFDDVRCYMEELASYDMNGREIRNALTTSRQLAKFQKTTVKAHHLKHVIKVSRRFDTYLNGVKSGFTGDQIARDAGIR